VKRANTPAQVGCAGLLVQDTFCGPLAAWPAEGELVVLQEMLVSAGGCAANVAIDLVRQGVAAEVVGCVGRDIAGDVLLESFARHQVGTSRVKRVEDLPTSTTVILLLQGQDRRYLHVVGANRAFNIEQIARDWLRNLKVFYLGGLFALPGLELSKLADLLQFCRACGVTTVLDVAVPREQRGTDQLRGLLHLIDVFLPNEDEARAFTGFTDPYDQLRALQHMGADTVIITRGAHGVVAARARTIWRCGAYQMAVVDPSGCGDAFTSGVIVGLLQGWNMAEMLRYASAIGASATRATGTTQSVFRASEAAEFVRSHPITVTEES
jgi:sugar/nucleoside kinase (ribokinase family)